MKISVVIPALNEEKNLPVLLSCLREQTLNDFEIVIADAGSTDDTKMIAENEGAKIVKGGLPGPGRNAGAKASIGDYILFLDADVKVEPTFLEDVYNEMDDGFFDLATCEFVPLSDLRLDILIHRMINLDIKITRKTDPKTFGFGIFCSRRLFNKIGGFDETVTVAEDCDFIKRGSQYSSMAYLETPKIYVNVRRYEKEGRLHYAKKGMDIYLHRLLKGEIRDDSIDYEFANYDAKKTEDLKALDIIEDSMLKLERKYNDVCKEIKDSGRRPKWKDFENLRQMQMDETRENLKYFFKRKKV